MLNIEQDLELSVSDREIHSKRMGTYDGRDAIIVEVYRGGYYDCTLMFDAATGVMFGSEYEDEPLRLRPKSETRAIDHFYLHAGIRDWPKEQWIKLPQEHFSDGSSAAERMKQHNGLASTHMSPFRFMVKKEVELSPVRDYPTWAEYRFASGDWERVPWANEPWAQTDETKHHFAHISKRDDSQIAFWETEAAACLDSPLTMAPGRYLQRYFSEVLDATEIRDWAVKVDAEAVLKFAHTPDEIYEVYAAPGGPQSCMRYADHSRCHDGVEWRSGINPVRIYGAGDLAVAYIERKDKIVGRALVWPDKKVAGRRYGDIERLNAALETEGYVFDSDGNDMHSYGNGGFNGARMLKIAPEGDPANFVMPYLDYKYNFDISDEFLILNRAGNHPGRRTDGVAFEPARASDDDDDDGDMFTCDACGDTDDESNACRIEGDDDWYCEDCYDALTRSCGRCSNSVHHDTTSMVDGESWCRSCVDEHSNTCDYCCNRFAEEDIVPVYDARYEGDPSEADVFNDACVECRDHEADDIQQDVNGVWIDVVSATHCDHCHNYFSGNLDEEECPTQTCVDRRAEEAEAEAPATENA